MSVPCVPCDHLPLVESLYGSRRQTLLCGSCSGKETTNFSSIGMRPTQTCEHRICSSGHSDGSHNKGARVEEMYREIKLKNLKSDMHRPDRTVADNLSAKLYTSTPATVESGSGKGRVKVLLIAHR